MVDDNVEGAVAGSKVHFLIWKVWLCKKNAENQEKNRGWLMTNVVGAIA
jgi:hypothetical protein